MQPKRTLRVRPTGSWTFLTILGAGALLDGTGRLGLQSSSQVVLVAICLSAGLFRQADESVPNCVPQNTVPTESMARRWSVQSTALALALLLLTAEVLRFVRRGGHDGFPVWLSDLFHEDNSSWIALGTSRATGGAISPRNFGSGTALLQGAVNGIGVLFAWARGIPVSSVGVAVMGVGLSYILLVAVVPLIISPITRAVWTRTQSSMATLGVGASLMIFTLRFMREVRDLGHLTAGFAVFALVSSTLMLVSERSSRITSVSRAQALWALSFSCLLWFPLRPLALLFALLALWDELQALRKTYTRRSLSELITPTLRAALFFAAVALRAAPDLSRYVSPDGRAFSRALVAAKGATYESFDFFLLITAFLAGVVLLTGSCGTRRERAVLTCLTGYAISARFLDRFTNLEFQYGSTKLLWIMLPPVVVLSASLLVRDTPSGTLQRIRLGGVAVFLGLLMANSTSFYGAVRSLGPLAWTEVDGSVSELDNPLATDAIVQWDEPGGIDLRVSARDAPIVCVMVDELATKPLPLWEFEPYRCTRKVSEMSLEHDRDRGTDLDSLERLWKSYALMGASFSEAVMGSAVSGNDLSRPALVLNQDGAILRSERTIDLLAQIALSDPVAVSVQREWSETAQGDVSHNVDQLDLEGHRVDLWVSNDVVEVVLVGDLDAMTTSVERTPRADVAELLGRDDLFAGLTIEHPAIGNDLRCLVLVDRQSNGTVAWSAGESCA